MKNVIIVVLLLSFSTLFAQKKYFKSAVKQGRSSSQFYKVNLNSSQVLTADKLKSYANKNHYFLKGIIYQTVNRFGDKGKGVKSFEFLSFSEFDKYIFEYELCHSIAKPNQYDKIISSPQGAGYFFHPFDKKFMHMSAVRWTGSIRNDKIHGEGIGFAKINNEYRLFMGTFEEGKPTKGCSFKVLYTKDKYSPKLLKTDMKKVFVAKQKDGLAAFKVGYKIGFIDPSFHIKIQPKFRKIIEEFNDGQAIVKNMDGEEIIIDKSGNKVDFTQNQKLIFLIKSKTLRELANYKKAFPNIEFDYNNKVVEFINSNSDIKYLSQLTNDENAIRRAKTKVDNSMWDSALQEDSQTAYNFYLENAPLKLHAAKANRKIAYFVQKEKDRLEKIRIAKLEKEKKEREEKLAKGKRADKERAKLYNLINNKTAIGHSATYETTYTYTEYFFKKSVNIIVKCVITDVYGKFLNKNLGGEENIQFEVRIVSWKYAGSGILNINKINATAQIEYDMNESIGKTRVVSLHELIIDNIDYSHFK